MNKTLSEDENLSAATVAWLAQLGYRVRQSRRLAGDASVRRFSRLWLEGKTASHLLMETGTSFQPDRDPFCVTAGYLRQLGLPVPRIIAVEGRWGLVLQEDLGDNMLEDLCHGKVAAGEEELEHFYRRAVDIIIGLQSVSAARLPRRLAAARLAFDEQKLFSELTFFHRHYFSSLLGKTPSAEEERILEGAYRLLSRTLSGYRPRVLCHRDFHSRNLMVVGKGLVMVDFQDARLGPDTYDLASLLRDSYVTIEGTMERRLIDYFREHGGLPGESDRSFDRRFAFTAVQRNLKAIGTFSYQTAVRGNQRYAGSIATTWRHLRPALSSLPELEPAACVLGRYAGEAGG